MNIPASNFVITLYVNVNNDELSDQAFREFVRNTLPIVEEIVEHEKENIMS
jgi:hypothetical protein